MSRKSKLTIVGVLVIIAVGTTASILLMKKRVSLPDYGITINMHGKVTNTESQIAFVKAYQQGNSGQWQEFIYTIEGDPIIYTVRYNNQPVSLDVSIDTRQDKFGSNTIETYTCQKMTLIGKLLQLEGCTGAPNGKIVVQ